MMYVQAAKKRSVVDVAPWQQALEALAQRQFPDAQPHLVVADGVLWAMVEDEVAEMGVGVEAAQVGVTEVHQDLVRSQVVAGVLEIVGLGNGICERIGGIAA